MIDKKTPACCICYDRPASMWGGKPSNFGACGNVSCLVARLKEINGPFDPIHNEQRKETKA